MTPADLDPRDRRVAPSRTAAKATRAPHQPPAIAPEIGRAAELVAQPPDDDHGEDQRVDRMAHGILRRVGRIGASSVRRPMTARGSAAPVRLPPAGPNGGPAPGGP
jgi:hypothetical protein